MMQEPIPAPQVGDLAPNCVLPDGSTVAARAASPCFWPLPPRSGTPPRPTKAKFSPASRGNSATAPLSSTQPPTSGTRSIAAARLAAQFGVAGQRALFLLDEARRGALENRGGAGAGFAAGPGAGGPGSARTPGSGSPARPKSLRADSRGARFVTATLAAAALLLLPGCSAVAASDPGQPRRRNAAGTRPDMASVTLSINGQSPPLQLDPRVALLDALRENLHLTGTKKGCDHGQCGACTVHLDGQSALSCLTLAVMAQGKEITTIEGLAKGRRRCTRCRPPFSSTTPFSAATARRGS